jgi:transposase-like protein
MKPNEPLTVQPNLTLADIKRHYAADDACKTLLRDMRWPDGVKCPRCGNDKVYTLKRAFHWQCRKCQKNGYRFSVITKTIFENTNYPLRTWFEVIYLMSQSKKGISALQVHRMMGSGSYKTAWYMLQRIRAAMQDEDFPKLMGTVEVDETYVGGNQIIENTDTPTLDGFVRKVVADDVNLVATLNTLAIASRRSMK